MWCSQKILHLCEGVAIEYPVTGLCAHKVGASTQAYALGALNIVQFNLHMVACTC